MGGVSRRDALKLGLGAMAGTILAGTVGQGVGVAASSPLQQASFDSLVGQKFTLHAPGGKQAVKLATVTPHAAPLPSQGDCFSLLFTAPKPVAPSGTYPLSNPALGKFSLLLSPVGPGGAGQRYEAVINRL